MTRPVAALLLLAVVGTWGGAFALAAAPTGLGSVMAFAIVFYFGVIISEHRDLYVPRAPNVYLGAATITLAVAGTYRDWVGDDAHGLVVVPFALPPLLLSALIPSLIAALIGRGAPRAEK